MSGEANFQLSDRLGSPKVATPSSPPSTGAVQLSFQANETIGQTSPPHNYRHSRAYRHFKNPPQPHMCIRGTTTDGLELFINVLSWTRIVIPQEPSDPIPLYGGMQVPPGSPRCPPLVYAVMANPEVLKDSGRHSKDPEERRAMVELMCDFVEAMNPDIKLTRNAVILKDRDISGELKDVWSAVQAQRDREREEEFARKHGLPSPDSIFYKGALRELQDRLQKQQQQQPQLQQTHNTDVISDNKVMYMEFGPESAADSRKDVPASQPKQPDNKTDEKGPSCVEAQSAIINSRNDISPEHIEKRKSTEIKLSDSNDMTDSKCVIQVDQQTNVENSLAQVNNSPTNFVNNQQQAVVSTIPQATTAATTTATVTTASNCTPQSITTSSTSTSTTTTTAPSTPTKKEKLGGFLPNGCHSIFPRFKNSKHKEKEKDKDKDKDKDKEKESNKSSSNSKEKTLLNTFKKSTAAAANALSKSQQDDSKTQFEKNCLNLNSDMEKLDINKLDSSDMLIKLKVASSGAK